jgi:GT2 family glycosyltransferase
VRKEICKLKNIVLCISFGHASSQIREALGGATSYAVEDSDTVVVVVDDCSGNAPTDLGGVSVLETPSRRGFAGVVTYVVDRYAEAEGRLLLINPDACLSKDAVASLLAVESGIAVPRVLNSTGDLENIRRATTAGEQLRALLFGERFVQRSVESLDPGIESIECPPFAPSGSVLSVPLEYLRSVPLRSEFFWLEQSDWVYRYANLHGAIEVSVLAAAATHTGASTSLRYPVSVAASQLKSKMNFVIEYGDAPLRLLLPLAVLFRAIRFGVKTRNLSNGWFLVKVALGISDWRVKK